MRNKSISLCDKSFEVAKRMPNFSGWIRKQLLAYQPKQEVKVEVKKKKTFKHATCRNCGMIGDHWTLDCPTLEAIE
jgi:hypothetical protein